MFKGQKRIRTTGTFARVTGYYRPVGAWNAGKQQEHKDRALTPAADIAALG